MLGNKYRFPHLSSPRVLGTDLDTSDSVERKAATAPGLRKLNHGGWRHGNKQVDKQIIKIIYKENKIM